jgi:hypothetical protein
MEGKPDFGFEWLVEKLFILLLLIDEKRSVEDDLTSSTVSTSLEDCDEPNVFRMDVEGPAVDFLAVSFGFPIDTSRVNDSSVKGRRHN